MSLFSRTIDCSNNAVPAIRAYVRVAFECLWQLGVQTVAAGAYGALGTSG
jgi:hypothetical protein